METGEKMRVDDLILILSKYPPDTKVALTGTEGGFYDVTYMDEMELILNYNNLHSGRGQHEDKDYVEMVDDNFDINSHQTETYLIIK